MSKSDLSGFSLEGKVALVTGASQGIGERLALGLAAAGARVALASRNADKLEKVAEEIRAAGGEGLVQHLDVRDAGSVHKATIAVLDEWDRLDVLVNNAGIVMVGDSVDFTEGDWDAVMDTNLKGAFFCCQEAARFMIPRGKGKIVNVTSVLGFVATDAAAAYCVSKGGMIQLTRALALEWAKHGINVNAVAPYVTRSPMTESLLNDPKALSDRVAKIPLGRVGETQDLVGAVTFLSSEASDFVTGQVLVVDGGYTIA
jgi:NAD(P)-dependent dehydrogenase (short-subunit alcohol dehydrogenase family)